MNEKLSNLIAKLNDREIEKKKKEIEKKKKLKIKAKEKEKERKRKKRLKEREKIKKAKKLELLREKARLNIEKRVRCRIIVTSYNKQISQLYSNNLYSRALKKFNELVEENRKNVIFPIKYISNKNISRQLCESKYEILLIKYVPEGENKVTELKDEYGKYVKNEIENRQWAVMEKHEYLIEETFFVYGYNPRTERKDFSFIFENFINKNKNNNEYFKRVILFLNKLVIEYDNDLDFVVCKNKEDAIRLYNAIEERCKKEKIKNIFFSGFAKGPYRYELIEKIIRKTGWERRKINRISTQT